MWTHDSYITCFFVLVSLIQLNHFPIVLFYSAKVTGLSHYFTWPSFCKVFPICNTPKPLIFLHYGKCCLDRVWSFLIPSILFASLFPVSCLFSCIYSAAAQFLPSLKWISTETACYPLVKELYASLLPLEVIKGFQIWNLWRETLFSQIYSYTLSPDLVYKVAPVPE